MELRKVDTKNLETKKKQKKTSLSSSLQQCEIDELRKNVELYKEKSALNEQENKKLPAVLDNEKRLHD